MTKYAPSSPILSHPMQLTYTTTVSATMQAKFSRGESDKSTLLGGCALLFFILPLRFCLITHFVGKEYKGINQQEERRRSKCCCWSASARSLGSN
jgi:hypothetical protein